jgi:hypothetical protein
MTSDTLVRETQVDPARQIIQIKTTFLMEWKDPKYIFKKT